MKTKQKKQHRKEIRNKKTQKQNDKTAKETLGKIIIRHPYMLPNRKPPIPAKKPQTDRKLNIQQVRHTERQPKI